MSTHCNPMHETNDFIQVNIQMFGEFHHYLTKDIIHIEIPKNSPLSYVRQALAEEIQKTTPYVDLSSLINSSALANENEILKDSFNLKENTTLAILPPVCGG